MKFKNLLSLLFIAILFSLTSCHDKEQLEDTVTPEPAAELTLGRVIEYENTAKRTSGYEPKVVKAIAQNKAEEFVFYSGVDNPHGVDHVNFTLKPEQLKPGFVGSYSLKSYTNAGTTDATVRFSHYTEPGKAAIFDSSFSVFEGAFEITAYDTQTKLVSGNYWIKLKDVNDPYATGEERFNPKKCEIRVAGTFKNVKVN